MRRRHLLAAPLFVFAAVPAARAATVAAYTAQSFAAAQAAGRPILVHINAGWCPTCAKQRPILRQIEATAACKNLQVFTVDFDAQEDVVRHFGATMQSTLIAFHGTRETARSVGETDPDKIAAVVDSALH